jgi:hypothetical protein
MDGVRRSIAAGLRWYSIVGGLSDHGPMLWLQLRQGVHDTYEVNPPRDLGLPRGLFDRIAREHPDLPAYALAGPMERRTNLGALAGANSRKRT